jgi:beta-lactam-binding protein with PASTA domain
MPDVIGQTIDQATTTLALDDLTLGSSVVEASSAASGTVICTVPLTGNLVSLSAPVDVGVSSGDPGSPPATLCDAPSGSPGPSTVPTQPAVSP